MYGFFKKYLTPNATVELLDIIREDHATRTITINFLVVELKTAS